MTGWINGLPRNRGRFRISAGALVRPEPQVKDRASWRMCQRCGSRNPYVGLFINRNNETRCVPDCQTAHYWANQIKEVDQ